MGHWRKRLYRESATDLDEADLSNLIAMMKEQEIWSTMVAAQVIQTLQAAKDKAEKQKK